MIQISAHTRADKVITQKQGCMETDTGFNNPLRKEFIAL